MPPRRRRRRSRKRTRTQRIYITGSWGRFTSLKKLWEARGPQGIMKRLPREFESNEEFQAWLQGVMDDDGLIVLTYTSKRKSI